MTLIDLHHLRSLRSVAAYVRHSFVPNYTLDSLLIGDGTARERSSRKPPSHLEDISDGVKGSIRTMLPKVLLTAVM